MRKTTANVIRIPFTFTSRALANALFNEACRPDGTRRTGRATSRYFGEDTKEYENGVVVNTEGSWEAGVDGAKAGIIMKARPRSGVAYRQEYYRGHAEDFGQVLGKVESVTVPAGSYHDVLETKEFTPLEPKLVEHKYYARGVGVVREVTVKGGSDRTQLMEYTPGPG
jgi:hypothetical protein